MSKAKPKQKPLRWKAISSSLAPDPRVSEESPEYGKRFVLVTVLIDELGRLWERTGKDAPVMLGTVPSGNDKSA
jgi:hypothetical protein